MSEQKGIATLIRPCATLARYEAALAAGEITSDVMVLIEDVRQIRWRGNIWNFVGKVEVNSVPYARAEGLILSDGTRFYLPSSAPADDSAHTFAMLSDLQGAGGVSQEDFDALYDGLVEAEKVAAAALNDLDGRVKSLSENVVGETVTKSEFEAAITDLSNSISNKADAQSTSEALTGLSGQVETLSGQVASAVTTDLLSSVIKDVNNTIIENEEITASALANLNARLAEIEKVMSNL